MDVLELFLDEEPAEDTKQEATAVPVDDDLELLMTEFRSAPDSAAAKDALMAMLQLIRK